MLRRIRRLRLRLPIPRNLVVPPRLVFALQLLALIIAVVIIRVADQSDTAPLAWALIALIAVSSLIRSLPAPEGLATLISIALYCGLQTMRTIQGANSFTEVFAGAFAFVLTAWFSRAMSHCLSTLEEEREQNARLVEELTARDKVTGAMKRDYAHQMLAEEIQRSRRYNHSLSLLMIGVAEWDTSPPLAGPQESARSLSQLVEVLNNLVRNVDKVARQDNSRFAVILPETPVDGARRVAEKICEQVTSELRLTVRVGIAEFPADAVSSEELIAESEAALEFSKTAALRITDRSLIT